VDLVGTEVHTQRLISRHLSLARPWLSQKGCCQVIADKLKYSKDVKKYDSLKVFEQKKNRLHV